MTLYNTDLVIINKYSRPGTKLDSVKGIVEHWTANPGAGDTAHQSFFDGLDGGGSRYAGAHIFVDRDSAVLIIPLDEVAYHANENPCQISKLGSNANLTTIGIEMCLEADGTIHPGTIARTSQITAHLCKFFNLGTSDIYRHYDVTGKLCPRPWVEKPILFDNFKKDVYNVMNPVTPHLQIPYKVIVPNTAHWQTISLVSEYMKRGYKCYGQCEPLGEHAMPTNSTPLPFMIETNYAHAIIICDELRAKGYTLAYGEQL